MLELRYINITIYICHFLGYFCSSDTFNSLIFSFLQAEADSTKAISLDKKVTFFLRTVSLSGKVLGPAFHVSVRMMRDAVSIRCSFGVCEMK